MRRVRDTLVSARRCSLRARLAAGSTVLIAAITLFIFLYFPARLQRQAHSALEDKATTVALLMAHMVSPALVFEDHETVQEYLSNAGGNGDLAFIAVLDSVGTAIAGYGTAANPVIEKNRAADSHRSPYVLTVSSPIVHDGRTIGQVRLGLSLQGLRETVAHSRQRIAFLSALLFLAGMLGAVALSTIITGPLARIAATAEQIAAGDLSRRAPVRSRDELGDLATSFNVMVDRVERAQGDLQQLNRSLEQRVAERTTELQEEIEERTRADAALRTSEEKFRAMFESAAVGMVLIDKRGETLEANPAMQAMLGYHLPDLKQQSLLELVLPDDRLGLQDPFRELLSRKRTQFTSENRYRRVDGSSVWCGLTVSRLSSTNGKRHFAIGMLENITHRKELEQRIQEEQRTALRRATVERQRAEEEAEKLAHIPRMNPNPVIEIAANGRITYVNEATREILEVEGIAEPVTILPPNTRSIVSECLETGAKNVGPEAVIGRRTLTWSFYPVVPNQVVYAYGFDITERLVLEAHLHEVQRLEAAGRLAGGVAHDFNNIIMTITGLTELLLGDLSEGDPMREDLIEIDKAADRAAGLTRQLLAFSRKQVLQPAVLDLNEVVTDMQKMLRRLIGEDVELATRLGTDLGAVKADPGQVEQVIMNLAVNARDAMPRGGQLAIATTDVDVAHDCDHRPDDMPCGRYTMLAVADNGAGMDERIRSRIFEPFFTTKAPGKGTGLGLATVYGIVKQSGGYVHVESQVGKGSTFRIYLPQVDESVETADSFTEPGASDSGAETILLVEDEDGVRILARRILEKSGYDVLDARHGGEALLLCERHAGTIDLLLTDVVMPQMSGRELAERLADVRKDMKVLYMTGYTDDTIIHHGVLDSDIALIQKPFKPEALLRRVREVLEDAPSMAGARVELQPA